MRIIFVIALLVLPSLAQAAYTNNAQVLRYEQDQNGGARLIMRFTGNAGEPIVDRSYHLTGNSTFQLLRIWVGDIVAELNLARAAGTAPQVAPGTVVTGLTGTPPVPPAKAIWREKAILYRDMCGSGFAGSVATACTTLKADIEATYQAGYLNE